MPLMDTDQQDGNLQSTEEEFRPRSGSTGLKNFFRRKHKSGTSKEDIRKSQEDSDSKNSSRQGSPTQTPSSSKVKDFFQAFRPRSKSDVDSMKAIRRRKSSGDPPNPSQLLIPKGRHRSQTVQEGVEVRSPPSSGPTAMSNLLTADNIPIVPSTQAERNRILEMYRSRAYSDPKPRARAAALAAAQKKRVSSLKLLFAIIV